MKILPRPLSLLLLSAALLPTIVLADAGTPVEQRLEQEVELLQQQLDALKGELARIKADNAALAAQQQALAAQAQAQQTPSAAPTGAAAELTPSGTPIGGGISANLSLWGYGEIYYTRPVHDTRLTEADLARAVFGIGYVFDENTIFNSEYEVEHAVTSSSDPGEFEVEQFYIDHQFSRWGSVKAGLFLMPFGLLNEHHEPTNFYGVQRNFVETLIIPSTWREGGVALHGDTPVGLGWDVGLTTGLDLGKWDSNPADPPYRTALDLEDSGVAPMQQAHQELALARAQHVAQYLSLNYSGMSGLLAGAAVFTGLAAVPSAPAGLPNQRTTLWEGHLRWTPGAADLSGVYARGHFSNTAAYNLANTGVSNPMPAEFLGYYLQAAYTVWQNKGYRFSPFVRWEHYDMGSSYEGIPAGFTPIPAGLAGDGKPWPEPRDFVWTLGASFFLNPHLVFKADYQYFRTNTDFTRLDLGLGLNF